MRFLFMITLLLLASDCDPEPIETKPSQSIVRICSERDLSDLIEYSNQWLSQTDVRFIQSADGCDATVSFESPSMQGAAGEARVLFGTVRLTPHADIRVSFMHEILHLAGVDHEDDRQSVMYVYAANNPAETRQLRPHHVEALRRLAGITPFGRVVRQIEVLN